MGAALPELDAYRAARIAALQRMLDAREGKPGFGRNVRMIRAEIARLQQPDGGSSVQAQTV